MGKKDPRIDAYIANSADFARPILKRLRRLVHEGCPDVTETLKWSSPSFEYKGMLCGMAAFKAHCIFGFWKHALVLDRLKDGTKAERAMGSYGRITKLSELPPDATLLRYIRKAALLNEKGVKVPAKPKKPKPKLVVPEDLLAALRRNRKALAAFEAFPPSHKREYVEWITEAKREETRRDRLATAVEWMAEGRSRNWKYLPK